MLTLSLTTVLDTSSPLGIGIFIFGLDNLMRPSCTCSNILWREQGTRSWNVIKDTEYLFSDFTGRGYIVTVDQSEDYERK